MSMASGRNAVTMSDGEIEQFLADNMKVQIATIGPDGSPHLTTLFYVLEDGLLAFWTYGRSQKVVNLRRDPRMSFLVETGQTYDQLRGVALEGRGVVIEDRDVVWDVCVDIFNRYNGEYSEEMKPFVEFMAKNRVVVRLDVDRVRSWDHRKLGMPAMELGGSTADFIE